MPSEEEEFIKNLNEQRERWRRVNVIKRAEEVDNHKMASLTELDDKLKELEAEKTEKIQRIQRDEKERTDGIREKMIEENVDFLRTQKDVIRKYRTEVEADLDSTKENIEGELTKLDKGIVDIEKKANQAENLLDEINMKNLDDQINKSRREEDFEKVLTREKRELEMEQIKDQTEVNLKYLDIREQEVTTFNAKEKAIHEQSLQHRQRLNEESLDFQGNVVNLKILDMESARFKSVNTCLNKLKKCASEAYDDYLECSETLDAITRKSETAELEKSWTLKAEESKKAPIEKSTIQMLDKKLRSLRGQHRKIKDHIDAIERQLSKTQIQEGLIETLKGIKKEIDKAISLITNLCSYTRNSEYSWEESIVKELKASINLINESVSNLNFLQNTKEEEKMALISKQFKKTEHQKALN